MALIPKKTSGKARKAAKWIVGALATGAVGYFGARIAQRTIEGRERRLI